MAQRVNEPGVQKTSQHSPQTQKTANIYEFNCLYTRDLRRKAKRWQDGFLRFHAFNRRVMVYDIPRNFIGDSHWRENDGLVDGDELQLERVPVLVQVGEAIRTTEQDLTELLEKRTRPRDEGEQITPRRRDNWNVNKHTSLSSIISKTPMPGNPSPGTSMSSSIPRPKSLNAVLGTPHGTHGRATAPTVSPYAQKHAESNEEVSSLANKRKHSHGSPSDRLLTKEQCAPNKSVSSNGLRLKPAAFQSAADLPQVVDISDDELPRKRKQAKTKAQPQHKSIPNSGTARPPSSPCREVLLPKPHASNQNPLPEPNARSEKQSVHTIDRGRPPNPLRLAPKVTRRKLLCQENTRPRASTGSRGLISVLGTSSSGSVPSPRLGRDIEDEEPLSSSKSSIQLSPYD
ncbi:MAG: hypothetical protein M4579_002848 [Chaenotheca gracillima]|nr:MAG: hypothetical protein M4579_002848 [Chaenotheca gracillima]